MYFYKSPVIMAVNNTKFGGAGIIMNPFSVSNVLQNTFKTQFSQFFLNDGMIDMFLSSQKLKAGIKTLLTFDEEAQKYKGIHAYNKNLNFYRGKVMKIVNNNYVPDKKGKKGSICSKNSSQNGKKNKNQSLSTTQEEFKQPLMTDEKIKKQNHGNPAMNYSSTNLSLKNYRGVPGEKMIQRMALDGEDLLFEDYVKFECLHGDLEIIVDYNYVMESQEIHFTHQFFNSTLIIKMLNVLLEMKTILIDSQKTDSNYLLREFNTLENRLKLLYYTLFLAFNRWVMFFYELFKKQKLKFYIDTFDIHLKKHVVLQFLDTN